MTVMIMMGIYGTNKCHIYVTLIRFMKDDDDYDNDQQIIDLHQKYNCGTWRLSHHVYVVRCQLLVSHLYLLPSDHNKGEWDLYHTPPLKCRKTPVGILETRAYGAAVPKSKSPRVSSELRVSRTLMPDRFHTRLRPSNLIDTKRARLTPTAYLQRSL